MVTNVFTPVFIGHCLGSFAGGYISGILLLFPTALLWLIIKKIARESEM